MPRPYAWGPLPAPSSWARSAYTAPPGPRGPELMSTPSVYRFAGCEVDPALRQVRCAGAVVESQPKALDLLLYLIAHRNRVVDKDELLEKIWPGVVVSESALTQALRKARAMIGDDGERQAVIRTIQRRGFRFVAELEDAPRAAAPAAPIPLPAP